MTLIRTIVLVFAVLPAVSAVAQDSGLPVKRVALYKNGVGYFEHLGRVRDNQEVKIGFTTGQLNDVLKTLTVLDLSGGRVTGISYGSSAPVERQLGELRLPVSEKATLNEFLGALRGARLELRSGTAVITGRLLSVERKTRIAGGTTQEVDILSLMTEGGEVKTAELSPAVSIKLLERGLSGKVDRLLDLMSTGREADIRNMVVSTAGTGERPLFVSYISEVPVWKSTYRIVLSGKAGQKPLLQGWAIVDNTVGQDWENVELSLVAGAPQSFLMNLSQPLYARRPEVKVQENAVTTPQTFQSTLIPGRVQVSGTVLDPSGAGVPRAQVKAYDASGAVVGEATTNETGGYELGGMLEGLVRLGIEAQGFRNVTISNVVVSNAKPARQDAVLAVGSVSERVEVTSTASSVMPFTSSKRRRELLPPNKPFQAPPPPPAYSVAEAQARVQSAAVAQDLGDLFEYKLKEPITIRKNQSALVPIVQSAVTAEKISVWNEQAGVARPLRALWLTNSSGLTLDGGSFSVLDEETFAGEGLFDPIRPGEKRIVSYATDLAVNASSKVGGAQQIFTRVRIDRGVLTQEKEAREKKTYTFRNEDSAARTVVIEHPVRSGFELRSEPKPVETTATWMRFQLPVPSKQTASLVVDEVRPISATYEITNLTGEQLGVFVQQGSIDKSVEEALMRVLVQDSTIRDLKNRKGAIESESEKIFDDQQRLRENMKALKGSAEEKALLQRYTKQLDEQENRLAVLEQQGKQLEKQIEEAQAALDNMIQKLSFDVKL